MNPVAWWRDLTQNPVYLREKGRWGTPNPFYEKLRRFSPLVVIGVIVLGACSGWSNPSLFAGNGDLVLLWCLVCVPGMLLSTLTLFGAFMAPALTAPLISLEISQGTWDVLRTTPIPLNTILLAKLFGALSRLRLFWWLLFTVSLFYGLLTACSLSLTAEPYALWGWALGLATVIRPWVEVVCAALLGMYLSTWIRSATIALASSYGSLVALKLVNNMGVWILVTTQMNLAEQSVWSGTLGPTAVYTLLLLFLFIALRRRARTLEGI